MNSEIVIKQYNDPKTSHQVEEAIVYENGHVYERYYEYADIEPFNSNLYYIILFYFQLV